jgi:uncharacterized membrane protein
MSLAPLLAAPAVVQAHAVAALAALMLGVVQLIAAKGTTRHRMLGWVWAALMGFVALSSFGITGQAGKGHWSWIHLISVGALVMLVLAVAAARRGQVARHRGIMLGLFLGALVITGSFTLMPGRIMGAVLFGW